MELHYQKDIKTDAVLDIVAGDILQSPVSRGDVRHVRVLAVIDEAILTENPLNPCWSNKVYSAQQIHNLGFTVIKKLPPK